jgi:hypothetical protein
MNKKLIELQEKIHSAAWLCVFRPPMGVDKSAWDTAINDLFEANQLIDKIVEKENGK